MVEIDIYCQLVQCMFGQHPPLALLEIIWINFIHVYFNTVNRNMAIRRWFPNWNWCMLTNNATFGRMATNSIGIHISLLLIKRSQYDNRSTASIHLRLYRRRPFYRSTISSTNTTCTFIVHILCKFYCIYKTKTTSTKIGKQRYIFTLGWAADGWEANPFTDSVCWSWPTAVPTRQQFFTTFPSRGIVPIFK